MSNFKMPTVYHPSNAEWVRPIESLTSDGVRELQRLKDENAKLRNEVDNLLDFEHLTSVAVDYAGCDECGEYKQTMLRLFDENAKLREHLNELLMIGSFGSCRRDCRYVDDCLADRFGQPDCFVCQELQELGIEAG